MEMRRGSLALWILSILGPLLLGACASQDFQQTYYLGVYDPNEDVTQQLYRVKVSGDTPWYSTVKYASGWAPAETIDALTGAVEQRRDGIRIGAQGPEVRLPPGRSLVLYGPEGFRIVPQDHRLVLVMSSDPSEFFKQVQLIAGAKVEADISGEREMLLELLQEESLVNQILQTTRQTRPR